MYVYLPAHVYMIRLFKFMRVFSIKIHFKQLKRRKLTLNIVYAYKPIT